MYYRKEIDGLRAIAVLSVMFFHAGFESVSGGFLGVDIFFVISGYLITSIILKQKETGTFSLTTFYERRIRRIFPALFFILIACLPFAWLLLLPHELKDFGQSLMAVSVFVSNIFFWQESDYFSADAEMIPLLHTWSLAVEEQYYLLFPLLMIILWPVFKNRIRKLSALFLLLAIASLAFSEWAWRHYPEANFYLLPSRAWELLAGVLAAFYLFQREQNGSQAISLIGLAMVLGPLFFLNNKLPFPSLYTLIPITGTMLIILFTSHTTWVGKLLSTPILVGIGLISYSAYLWHQPLFVFARLQHFQEPPAWQFFALILLTLLLAFLSWRFIEQPFRNRQNFTQRQVFLMGALMSIGMILIGYYLATQ
jgi:peptidoglycan/LPS O-acetylase OafA/YrhL